MNKPEKKFHINNKEISIIILTILMMVYFFFQLYFLKIEFRLLIALFIGIIFYFLSIYIFVSKYNPAITIKKVFLKILFFLFILVTIRVSFIIDYQSLSSIPQQSFDQEYLESQDEIGTQDEEIFLIDPNIPVVNLDNIKDSELKSIFTDINELLSNEGDNTTLEQIKQNQFITGKQELLTFKTFIPLIMEKYLLSSENEKDVFFTSNINKSPDYKHFKTAYYLGLLKYVTNINEYVKCKDLALFISIIKGQHTNNKDIDIYKYYWEYATQNNLINSSCNQENQIITIENIN